MKVWLIRRLGADYWAPNLPKQWASPNEAVWFARQCDAEVLRARLEREDDFRTALDTIELEVTGSIRYGAYA